MITATDNLLEHGAWSVDRSRSSVGFAIRHLGVATVCGWFSSFAGRIDVTDAGLQVDGWVEVASVDTGDRNRDRRLRSELFVADHHPLITFRAERAARRATTAGCCAAISRSVP